MWQTDLQCPHSIACSVSVPLYQTRVWGGCRLESTPIDSSLSIALWQFDAAADGQRFLIATPESDALQPINVIVNWQSLLQR